MAKNFIKFQRMPFTVGLEVEGNRVLQILARGTPLPAESRNIFTTIVSNQLAAEIHLVKGESVSIEGVDSLARLLFPGTSSGRPRLEILLSADLHGFIEVNIKDLDSGREMFTLLSDLSNRELLSSSLPGKQQELLEGKVFNLMTTLQQLGRSLGLRIGRDLSWEIRDLLLSARGALASHDTPSLCASQVCLESLINTLYTLQEGNH